VTYPCIQQLVKAYVPGDRRSRALALIYSGGQVGTILALLSAPLIISTLGWRYVFYLYGSLGLFWTVAWRRLVPDVPPPPPATTSGRPPLPAAATGGGLGALAERVRALPWRTLSRNKPFLAIVAAHSAFGVGHYITLSWLPTYFAQNFGGSVQEAAGWSLLPWVVSALTTNVAGWAADALSNSGTLTLTQTRKLMQAVGGFGPAGCLLYLSAVTDAESLGAQQAAGVLILINALGAAQAAGYSSNHGDITRRYAGTLFGLTNALSSLLGSVGVYGTGRVLDATHSWAAVFQAVAVTYVAGAVTYIAWASAELQDFDEE